MNNNKTDFRKYHIVTYNREIKYGFIDYLRANNITLLGVSGYYFDGRGREGYYIEFEVPVNTDLNAIDEFIESLYREYER